MMILLSKKEYDGLILKASALELQVEQRVEEEKRRLLEHIRLCIAKRPYQTSFDNVEYIRRTINELLQ